jgi:hypothetical protein
MNYSPPPSPAETDTLDATRRIILAIVVASLIGIETELILLDHIKPVLQLVPVISIVLGVGSISWYAITRNARMMRIFQGTMFLCVFSGFLGIVLHLAFDIATVQKKDKTLQGYELLRAAVNSTAPPLAPGAMIQIGLLGLAYTFRHPVLNADGEDK